MPFEGGNRIVANAKAVVKWGFFAVGLPLLALASCARPKINSDATIRVVAAASLRPALLRVQTEWEASHPQQPLALTFGATGALVHQIQQGLPCDLFLAADQHYPQQLGPAIPFAQGKLGVWCRAGLSLQELKQLDASSVGRIAIANPKVAPYGALAEQALRQAGVLEAIPAKLVFPGNVEEVAAAVRAGAVDVAFLPETLGRLLPPSGGEFRLLPAHVSAVLVHAGVARTEAGAAVMHFLRSPQGQELLASAGLDRWHD
jgi:molybdate transport system substrate-binding protein